MDVFSCSFQFEEEQVVRWSRNSFAEDIDRLLQRWYLCSPNISMYKNIKIVQYLKAYVKNVNHYCSDTLDLFNIFFMNFIIYNIEFHLFMLCI